MRQERSRQPKKKFNKKKEMRCNKCRSFTAEYKVIKVGAAVVVVCDPSCPPRTR